MQPTLAPLNPHLTPHLTPASLAPPTASLILHPSSSTPRPSLLTPLPSPLTRPKAQLKPTVQTESAPHPDAVAALAKLRFC